MIAKLTPTVFKKSPESKIIYGTEDISSLKTSSNFYQKNNKSLNLSIFAILNLKNVSGNCLLQHNYWDTEIPYPQLGLS